MEIEARCCFDNEKCVNYGKPPYKLQVKKEDIHVEVRRPTVSPSGQVLMCREQVLVTVRIPLDKAPRFSGCSYFGLRAVIAENARLEWVPYSRDKVRWQLGERGLRGFPWEDPHGAAADIKKGQVVHVDEETLSFIMRNLEFTRLLWQTGIESQDNGLDWQEVFLRRKREHDAACEAARNKELRRQLIRYFSPLQIKLLSDATALLRDTAMMSPEDREECDKLHTFVDKAFRAEPER